MLLPRFFSRSHATLFSQSTLLTFALNQSVPCIIGAPDRWALVFQLTLATVARRLHLTVRPEGLPLLPDVFRQASRAPFWAFSSRPWSRTILPKVKTSAFGTSLALPHQRLTCFSLPSSSTPASISLSSSASLPDPLRSYYNNCYSI